MANTRRGLAYGEILLLLAIRGLDSTGRHLYKIVKELESKTRTGDVNVANVFKSLKTLERKGFLESHKEECTRTSKSRKLYALTAIGEQLLRSALGDITSLGGSDLLRGSTQ
jgi:DNA-binding PadR family transcriptional regulator